MLTIEVPARELWDEGQEKFIATKACTIVLEHSLVSVSKWEAKWKKEFLSTAEKTEEETLDYIRCMTITQNVDPNIYKYLSQDIIKKVNEYISDPMTATTFSKNDRNKNGGKSYSKQKITSELIYYWMIALEIPMECQRWHLNRLLTLIKVCQIKNDPGKKMSKKDILSSNARINAARRKASHSKG